MASYTKIRKGCELYHDPMGNEDGQKFDEAYVNYFNNKSDNIDEEESYRLVEFLDDWKCFVHLKPEKRRVTTKDKLIKTLPPVLRNIVPLLDPLKEREKTILTVQGNDLRYITKAYEKLCNVPGVGDTIASKILHTINPELFVMWDNSIKVRQGHPKSIRGDRITYCRPDKCAVWFIKFLREMKDTAKEAVNQVGSVESLKSCLHDSAFEALKDEAYLPGLAKIIDEYNYMKYTKKHRKLAD